jgi:CRP/FNR family transcriptional regulator, dissimilatory nitrate respiration regulator
MEASMDARKTIPRQSWDRRLILGVLENTELLRGMAPAPAAALAAQCWTIEVKRTQQIVSKGGRVPGLFAVAYGTVKLALRQNTAAQRVVRLVQAGQTFGEATALLGRAAGFEAMAVTACRLVIVPAAAVLDVIDRDPRGARQVVCTLARRNLELLEEIESSSMRRSTQRLAAYLGSLAGCSNGNGVCKVRLPATKTLIASRLDMKKETLSRLLRALVGDGLITVQGGEITLLDRDRLGQLA